MFLQIITILVIVLAICGLCFIAVASLLSTLYSSALFLSRISFSFLAGLALVQNGFSVVENSTLNYIIAVAVSLAVILFVVMFTRANWAVKFGTSLLVSYIFTFFMYGIALALIGIFVDINVNKELSSGVGYYVIRIGCVIFSLSQTVTEMADEAEFLIKFKDSKFFEVVDRVLASFIYGCSFWMYMLSSSHVASFFQKPLITFLTIGIIGTLTYLADIYLVGAYRERKEQEYISE